MKNDESGNSKPPVGNHSHADNRSQEDEGRGREKMSNAPTTVDLKGDKRKNKSVVNPTTEPPNENGRGEQ